MSTAIAWFRRDLRLEDNPAWSAAAAAERVIPLFIVDPALYDRVSARRRGALVACLRSLDDALALLGGRLRVEVGEPARVLARLIEDEDIGAIHANRDVTPYALSRDRTVADALGSRLTGHDGLYLQRPGSIRTKTGTPMRVFTPFHRVWVDRPWGHPAPPPNPTVSGDRGAGIPDDEPLPGHGIAAAERRLTEFAERVATYPTTRDRPDLDETSRLSIDLKYGSLGPGTARAAVDETEAGGAAWVRQLAWRDFHAHVLAIEPTSVDESIRPELRSIAWRDDDAGFRAWTDGLTGYPMVDAAMRQLAGEGFIHNRARMVAASFLVKHLLIDWRRGERHFRRHLLDGDVAQNAGNWQWVAGTGTDAAPFFRIFNPITQGQKFDPDGDYIRRWVPELAELQAPAVHEPWEHPLACAAAGVTIGVDYPAPIVDHSTARQIALDAYEASRS